MLPGIAGMMPGPGALFEFEALGLAHGGGNDPETFSYDVGDAHPDTRLFIIVHWAENGGTHRTLSTVTVDGNNAPIIEQNGHTGGVTGFGVAIASLMFAEGGTQDVVCNWSGDISNSGIAVIRAVGLVNSSATDTEEDFTSTTSGSLSVALDIPAHGLTIAAFTSSTNAADNAVTWGGVTEEYDIVLDGLSQVRASMAWNYDMTLQVGRTISVSVASEADSGNGMVATSWA